MHQLQSVRIVLRTRVGKDGVLEIHTPTPFASGEVEVELYVRPVDILPKGAPGYKVAALAGSISDTDAEAMLKAINDCTD
ncbi:MAG: hypothetical protein NZM28_01445 [Fimbriimonadales bacterium]|nr:hypothetical protein [Fimbriimonadales bacterium]